MKVNNILGTINKARRIAQGSKSLAQKGINIAKKVDSKCTALDRVTVDPVMRFLFDDKR